MATFDSLSESLRRSSNQRFPPSLKVVNRLLNELRPQSGALLFFDAAGTSITLDTVPQKITQFTAATLKNTEIVPDFLVTNGLLINNPDGLAVEISLDFQLDVANNRTIVFEIYVDDVATGITFSFEGSNSAINSGSVEFTVEAANGTSMSLYIYGTSGSSNADIFLISMAADKIPLYLDAPISAAAPLPPIPTFAANLAAINGTKYLNCGNDPSLQFTGNMSCADWVQLAATGGDRYIFSKWNSVGNQRGWHLRYNGSAFHIEIDANGSGSDITLDSVLNPSASVLYHVGFTYDGSDVRIFINGVEDNSVAYSGGIHNSTNDFLIGAVNNGIVNWNGDQGFAGIWDEALVEADFATMYHAGVALCYDNLPPSLKTDLVSYWHLATWTGSSGSPIVDRHGANHATNVNGIGFTGSGLTVACTQLSTVTSLHMTGDGGFTDLSSNEYAVGVNGATVTAVIPAYNNHKALNCDGVNDFFQSNLASTIFNNDTFDIYIVCKKFTATTFEPLINWLLFSDADSYSFISTRNTGVSSGTQIDIRELSNASQFLSDTTDVGANLVLVNMRVDALNFEYSINGGVPVSGVLVNKRIDHDTLNFGALVRSIDPGGVVWGDYDYADIKIFASILSPDDRLALIASDTARYSL